MLRALASFVVCFLLSSLGYAQTGKVIGVIKDRSTGETLPFANVLYGSGKGTTADLDGAFEIELPYGTYTFEVSYTGLETQRQEVVVNSKSVNVNFKMKQKANVLTEVEITGDIAKERETPVAFTNVLPAQIEEELASQDLPMVLNSTPGVYATQQGGGDGDARITIRGFDQQNVAVMIDGIPVNDMENGRVFWSNWFGLDAVTRTIQVQRGLGASKIAIPSVGGTMNILTKGIDSKKGVTLKQEYGTGNFLRTSLGLTTGKLKGGWGFTAAGSFKRGDGWVDEAYTNGFFYFLKAEKKLGNHLLSVAAMGAPQEHGQRSWKQPIAVYDSVYAADLGVRSDTLPATDMGYGHGLNYNTHWGYVEDYTVRAPGDTVRGTREVLREQINYYHKPQFSLRDFWAVNDKLYISTVAYLSIGTGGGTSARSSISAQQYDENGQIDWQSIYDANSGNNRFGGLGIDLSIDPNWSETEHKSGQIIASAINNHFWYGALSTFTYRMNDSLSFSGGLDYRSYKGEHYTEVYDLVGGDYYIAEEYGENQNPYMLRKGDKFRYHNDGLVKWGGVFGQVEYTTPAFSTFFNASYAASAVKRVDYFLARDIVIDGQVFQNAVDLEGTFYYDANTGTGQAAYTGSTITTSGDSIYVDNPTNQPGATDGWIVPTNQYFHDSPETRTAQTDWVWLHGLTLKTGANFNFSEYANGFANVGFISKGQRLQTLVNRQNQVQTGVKNEQIRAFELGYSQRRSKWALNVNSYFTQWKNKPGSTSVSLPDDPDTRINVSLRGMHALHMGIEFDGVYKVTTRFDLEGLISLGNWKWTSSGDFTVEDPNSGAIIDTIDFNAKGLNVGDAAQTQYAASFRYEFWRPLETGHKAYLKARYTYFDRHYANFDPLDFRLDDPNLAGNFEANGDPRQSWLIPSYGLLDVHLGVTFKLDRYFMTIRGSVLNALDTRYLSDANNNDDFNSQNPNPAFDASSTAVFFGQGRRFNTSLSFKF